MDALFVFAWLVLGGLGAPLPEDVALLAAGAMIERGEASAAPMFVLVMIAVLAGDATLFFGARKLGPAALARRPFSKLLPPARRAKLERAYARYGGLVVFVARHVAGVRAAAFAMAGISGMAPRKFLAFDAAAACIGVPVLMTLGYAGSQHVGEARAVLATAAVAGALAYVVVRRVRAGHGIAVRSTTRT